MHSCQNSCLYCINFAAASIVQHLEQLIWDPQLNFGAGSANLNLIASCSSKVGKLGIDWQNKLEVQCLPKGSEWQMSSGPSLKIGGTGLSIAIESDGLHKTDCMLRVSSRQQGQSNHRDGGMTQRLVHISSPELPTIKLCLCFCSHTQPPFPRAECHCMHAEIYIHSTPLLER